MSDKACVNCGRGIGWGDKPCVCKRTVVAYSKPDREFLMAVATKPDNCTCDFPVIPQHRFDCSVYGPVDRPNFGPRKGPQTGMTRDELLAELMTPTRGNEPAS